MNPAELDNIRRTVNESPWKDPARYPECVQIAITALGDIAAELDPEKTAAEVAVEAAHTAEQALRQMARRAHFGGPLDEPTGEQL